ncbi:PREDICTED: protein FLC EXPRESSOR isoform X1 [Prunus mume]|uniref:Protein FLC EXPRESSOR isoform X1 n=1 Tax=Prunus mume TaxID=102107 RepID=A0ABM1LM63_PRUMU|nr:PREDICTED: protein FLC EXPRESSOR isoform X1 [Prunus mume]
MAGRDPRQLHRLPVLTNTTALEDRIGLQHREIQALLVDNQRLAATHVALKQDLAAAQHDLRRLSVVAGQAKAERDAEVREVYERSLKLDAEVRTIDSMGAELARTRADIQELGSVRKELVAELQSIEGEVAKTRSESKRVVDIKADIETFQQENKKGRVAIENETKTRAKNLEYRQGMEKTMAALAREIEKLHGELANAEKRARAAVAAAAAANPGPGYPATYGDPEMVYGGNAYPAPYGMLHQVCVCPWLLNAFLISLLLLCMLLLSRLKSLEKMCKNC